MRVCKRSLVMAVTALVIGSMCQGQALAVSCISGSLASYMALGASGCTIGTATFAGFSYSPDPSYPLGISAGAPVPSVLFSSNPSAAVVSVIPVDAPFNPGIKITGSGGWGVDGTIPPPPGTRLPL